MSLLSAKIHLALGTILKCVFLFLRDRYIVYSMCRYLLIEAPGGLDTIKEEHYETDFVFGFIQAMDSEKDPRNLLVCFECLRVICQNLQLGPFVEETFEVFSCYFPIDFTPVSPWFRFNNFYSLGVLSVRPILG